MRPGSTPPPSEALPSELPLDMPVDPSTIKAIITDTGGTVFDWHSAVLSAFTSIGGSAGLTADWSALTKTWRKLSTTRVDKGLPFGPSGRVEMDMDDVLLETLLQTLTAHEIDAGAFSDAQKKELVLSWRQMAPWSDVPSGVARLRKRLIVCPFTILKTRLVIDASRGKVDWDTIISCEQIGVYKTDPRTYATAVHWLDLTKEEVLLVTTHNNDMTHGKKFGLRTAFVYRPKEWYDMASLDPEPAQGAADFVAKDFEDLATQLGL